jgi:aspartyl-tRNA(Asn)/glutamyl-tRNA(Gln) amidotransferase subunit B
VKEDSHDYRYFPDPDLPKLFIKEIEEFDREVLEASLQELPQKKRERYKKDFGFKDEDIEIYVRDLEWGKYFEEVAAMLEGREMIMLASNYIISDLKSPVAPESFSKLIQMVSSGEISSRGAKDILKILGEKDGDPKEIARDKNLIQESDREVLEKIVKEVITENKNAPVQFLVGQAMKKSEGRANPIILQELFLEMLDH